MVDFEVIPEINPVIFGVVIVIGTTCRELVAVFEDVNEISPLQFPFRLKEYPVGSDKFTVPVSLIEAQTPNLSEVPEVVEAALIHPFEQASGLETFIRKLDGDNEKSFNMEVLVTVKESVPERYPKPLDPN
jgi:hypothetical protein